MWPIAGQPLSKRQRPMELNRRYSNPSGPLAALLEAARLGLARDRLRRA